MNHIKSHLRDSTCSFNLKGTESNRQFFPPNAIVILFVVTQRRARFDYILKNADKKKITDQRILIMVTIDPRKDKKDT